MAGLDIIKGYKEGEDVTPVEVPVDDTSGGGGLQIAVGKKGQVVPAGKVTADVDSSKELLKNMQDFLDQRNNPWRTLSRGLERMSAWAVPSLGGEKAQALNTVMTRQNQEEQDTLKAQNDMAAMKAAIMQQENFNKLKMAGPGAGPGVGAGGAGGAGGDSGGGMGAGLDPNVQQQILANSANMDEYRKNLNTYIQNVAKSQAEHSTEIVDMPVGNTTVKMTRAQAAKLAQSNPVVSQALAALGGGQGQQTPTTGMNMPQVGAQPGAQPGGVNAAAIQKVESGGNPNAISPKGAQGAMQVMPNTQAAPGFGVTPAANKSPEELQRVGQDYYTAMQKKYGNDTLAAVAYNMGPAATDAWLAKGGNFNQLPKETQDYIGRVHLASAMQGRQPTASATAAPISIGDVGAVEAAKKQREVTSTKAGEREAQMMDLAAKTADTVRAADTVTNIAENSPHVMGIGKGADARSIAAGAVGMFAPRMNQHDAEEFIANKTLSKDDLAVRDTLDAASKQLGIDYAATAFKGARMGVGLERMALDAKGVGTQYLPETNKANAAVIKEAALFNRDKLQLWKDFKAANGGDSADFNAFEQSKAYQDLEDRTQKKLAAQFPKYFSERDAVSTGDQKTTSSGVKYRIIR